MADNKNAVTADAVRWAYRLFLDREPESDDAIAQHMKVGTIPNLRYGFFNSAEFRQRNPPKIDRVPVSAPALDVQWEVSPNQKARLYERIATSWNRLGETDAHWSVLSSEDFRAGTIEQHKASFYDTGRLDVALIEGVLGRVGRTMESIGKAVEYGCGVGRVSVHLAPRVGELTACDISPSHLRLAQEAATERGVANVRFERSRLPDFGIPFGIDLWFSSIVLQHNPPPIIADVLKRALTCLNRGGIALFQVPTYQIGYGFNVDVYLASPESNTGIEMHVLPQRVIFDLARIYGLTVLDVREDDGVGIPEHWVSNTFTLMKR